MPAPAPDPDPGFAGMTDWNMDTYFCGAALRAWALMSQGDELLPTRYRKGRISEEVAAVFAEAHGLLILERNFRCPLGEIDLIAQDGPTIVFVEVRSRYGMGYGLPQESVTREKQKRLTQLAQWYLKARRLEGRSARFDVLAILWKGQEPEITWIPNAFEATQ